jgi:hypothetical protein
MYKGHLVLQKDSGNNKHSERLEVIQLEAPEIDTFMVKMNILESIYAGIDTFSLCSCQEILCLCALFCVLLKENVCFSDEGMQLLSEVSEIENDLVSV